ncbi:archaeal ATPase [Galdieria sulphuraria]|uniref:Archaeal ATPase n=1 Tax=Galdieria sulphuraria TaxID=130081 RepID=M2Y303_GALSU|nr:archaeal ATPase [Galdieria sulphuraria]EME30318.1 archaeal ATPase [Galdieria sulphuraria]|eukprot:XP_005706838.1 archaeal ATPase [Galdieria sulphuraria]
MVALSNQSYLLALTSSEERKVSSLFVGESEKANRRCFLEKLKKASLLYVDLRKLKPIRLIEEKRNLKWALCFLLYRLAYDQMGLPFMKPNEAYRHIPPYPKCSDSGATEDFGHSFRSISLVAFDEVGVLDTKGTFFQLEKNEKGVVRLFRYHSKGLSIKNYVAFGLSKVTLHFISLSPLDASIPVYDVLCSSSFSVNELADSLLEYTGGIPGLLTLAVNMLLNYVEMRNQPFMSKEVQKSG